MVWARRTSQTVPLLIRTSVFLDQGFGPRYSFTSETYNAGDLHQSVDWIAGQAEVVFCNTRGEKKFRCYQTDHRDRISAQNFLARAKLTNADLSSLMTVDKCIRE